MYPTQNVLYRKLFDFLSPYDSQRIADPHYQALKQEAEKHDICLKKTQEQSKFILQQLGQQSAPPKDHQLTQDIRSSPSSPRRKRVKPQENNNNNNNASYHTRSRSVYSQQTVPTSLSSQNLPRLQLAHYSSESSSTAQTIPDRQLHLSVVIKNKDDIPRHTRIYSQPQITVDTNLAKRENRGLLTKTVVYEESVPQIWSELKFKGKLCEGRSFSSGVIFKGVFFFYGGYDPIKGVFKDFISIRISENAPSSFDKVELTGQTNPEDAPGRLCRHGGVLRNGSMIIFGGKSSSLKTTNDMFEFSFEDMQFKRIQPRFSTGSLMPAIDSHSLHYDQKADRLILFGGYFGDTCSYSNRIFCYSFSTGLWEEIHPVLDPNEHSPKPRGQHGAALKDNLLYVFGGTDGDTILEDFWCFDIDQKKWNQILTPNDPIQPGPRSGVSLIEHQGFLILFGGFKALTNERNDLVIFNCSKQHWVYQSVRREINDNIETALLSSASPARSIQKSFNLNSNHYYNPQQQPQLQQHLPPSPLSHVDSAFKHFREPSINKSEFSLSPTKFSRIQQQQSAPKMRLFLPLLYRDEVSAIIIKRKEGQNKAKTEKKRQFLSEFNVNEQTRKELLSPIPILQSMKSSLNMLSSSNATHKYDGIYRSQLRTQNLVSSESKIQGKHPGARSGYVSAIVGDKLIIFGGDRHRMSLNDCYELNLSLLIDYVQKL